MEAGLVVIVSNLVKKGINILNVLTVVNFLL